MSKMMTRWKLMQIPCLIAVAFQWIPVSCQLRGAFDDPKTVIFKNDQSSLEEQEWTSPTTIENLQRPINILSLGGSVTWGATLEDRNATYPLLVGSPNLDHVDNLATPEMGSYYSAMCLESIIPDSATKNYDVILLDFISSEFEGFHWLLQRLRERYPDAILIYIHIWPLKALVQDSHGLQPDVLGLDPEIDWSWYHGDNSIHKFHPQMSQGTRRAVIDVGGHFFHLPFPKEPKDAIEWFSYLDWWHLSALGHAMIANDLLNILSNMKDDLFKEKRLGSFGLGDQCYSWVANGEANITYFNAIMTKNPKDESENDFVDEWFLQNDPEHPENPGEIILESKFPNPSSIILSYIGNRELEFLTNSVEVSINDQPAITINPNHFFTPKFYSNVQYAVAGEAVPGRNVVKFKAVDLVLPFDLKMPPFGLVGLLINGDMKSKNVPIPAEAQSTGRHIVYCFMQPDPRFSEFSVNLDAVESVISTTAGRLSPTWNVHVITNTDEAVRRLSAHSNLKVVDYRHSFFSHRIARFKKAYIHQSLNDIEYEKFCMYRWIIIYEYFEHLQMRGVSVQYILTADSDLMVLSDPSNIDREVVWSSIESYKIIDGGLILWSLSGLQSYSDFYLEIYASPENAKQMVATHGMKMKMCREDKSLLLPCFKQGDVASMYHISDMNWYNVFCDVKPETRLKKSGFACAVIGIWPGSEYRFTREGDDIKYNNETLCVIHFNNIAKPFAIPFRSFVTGEASEYVIEKY